MHVAESGQLLNTGAGSRCPAMKYRLAHNRYWTKLPKMSRRAENNRVARHPTMRSVQENRSTNSLLASRTATWKSSGKSLAFFLNWSNVFRPYFDVCFGSFDREKTEQALQFAGTFGLVPDSISFKDLSGKKVEINLGKLRATHITDTVSICSFFLASKNLLSVHKVVIPNHRMKK